MRVCILLLLMVAPLFGQDQRITITGTVTNSSGDRIVGVKVYNVSYSHVLTDSDGRYEIDVPQPRIIRFKETIRFSHPEYNAVIKIVSNDKIDVVLQKITKASDNKRIIPHCPENDNLVGWKYKATITSNSKDLIKAFDIDYGMIRIPASNNNEGHLMLLSGPSASSGMPSGFEWPFLEKPHDILYNRDIEYENQRKNERGISFDSPIDVKAQSNGKLWRFMGDAFNVVSYWDVSEETAREFDDIIDTICYSSTTANNPQ